MDQFMIRDARQYDFAMAQWIAHEHAKGDSLQSLHDAHPDNVPEPLIIARWRREFPAFDALMVHAERARAALLAEEQLQEADNTELTASQAANRMKARQWLAGKLDPGRFGKVAHAGGSGSTVPPANDDSRRSERALSMFSEDDLQEIIRAGLKARSIEGTSTRLDPPGTPPSTSEAGLEQEDGSGTPQPRPSPADPSVTTNATDDEPEF